MRIFAANLTGRRAAIWLLVGACLLLVIGANAHFLYVATMSQPDCVAHVRHGEGVPAQGVFSAATIRVLATISGCCSSV